MDKDLGDLEVTTDSNGRIIDSNWIGGNIIEVDHGIIHKYFPSYEVQIGTEFWLHKYKVRVLWWDDDYPIMHFYLQMLEELPTKTSALQTIMSWIRK